MVARIGKVLAVDESDVRSASLLQFHLRHAGGEIKEHDMGQFLVVLIRGILHAEFYAGGALFDPGHHAEGSSCVDFAGLVKKIHQGLSDTGGRGHIFVFIGKPEISVPVA